jgi:hypothetical protein
VSFWLISSSNLTLQGKVHTNITFPDLTFVKMTGDISEPE